MLNILIFKDRESICGAIGRHQPPLDCKPESREAFFKLTEANNLSTIVLDKPLALEPVTVKKPWGEEIWFSGIEERGVSSSNGIPITFLIEIFGDQAISSIILVINSLLDIKQDEPLEQEERKESADS